MGAAWENQTEQTPERLDLWSCHCRKATFSLLFTSVMGATSALLPTMAEQSCCKLVSCGTPVWVLRWVRDRHTASPGFFKQLFAGFCLVWFGESHLPWHSFPSLYTFLFFFPHFCLLLLWSYFWQGWLIDRHLFIQGSSGICQYWLDPMDLVKIKNITITT